MPSDGVHRHARGAFECVDAEEKSGFRLRESRHPTNSRRPRGAAPFASCEVNTVVAFVVGAHGRVALRPPNVTPSTGENHPERHIRSLVEVGILHIGTSAVFFGCHDWFSSYSDMIGSLAGVTSKAERSPPSTSSAAAMFSPAFSAKSSSASPSSATVVSCTGRGSKVSGWMTTTTSSLLLLLLSILLPGEA